MFPTVEQQWAIILAGVSDADIQAYIDEYGLTPEAPTDPKVIADLTTTKAAAAKTSDRGFEAVLNKILTYGDKVLTILSKNGVIGGSTLRLQGYNIDSTVPTKATDSDDTNNAPSASNRVFNLDFSDPKVLIIFFLVLMILIYFLFFNSKKHGKR